MSVLTDALIVVLYIVLILLVISLIVLSIKLIVTLKKVDYLVDNITRKVESLDAVFDIVDGVTSRFGAIGEAVSGAVLGLVKKVFNRKGKEEEEDYE